MTAILKKELSSFFTSPLGYVVLAIYYLCAGFFFRWLGCIGYGFGEQDMNPSGSNDMSLVFSNMFLITILIIPIITMKSFSEEKKQKTDQALLTSPLGLGEIVIGKFLGSLVMFLCCMFIYVLLAFSLSFYNAPDWSVFIGNLLGITLLGATMIAINIFISSLTESVIISAIVGIFGGLVMWVSDIVAEKIATFFEDVFSITWFSTAYSNLSFSNHFQNFTTGILRVSDIVFFLSIIALFIFLTLRVLERRRWS